MTPHEDSFLFWCFFPGILGGHCLGKPGQLEAIPSGGVHDSKQLQSSVAWRRSSCGRAMDSMGIPGSLWWFNGTWMEFSCWWMRFDWDWMGMNGIQSVGHAYSLLLLVIYPRYSPMMYMIIPYTISVFKPQWNSHCCRIPRSHRTKMPQQIKSNNISDLNMNCHAFIAINHHKSPAYLCRLEACFL